jgi:ribosomal protein S18 acetylase RimI-like enzyme
MNLRAGTIADYAAIRDLLHDSDAYHARHSPDLARLPDTPRFTQEELAELLSHDTCLVIVVEEAGAVIGFLEASIQHPERTDEAVAPWCGINNLAVAERWRRRGIARALIETAETWARRNAITQVRLDVFEFNAGARALYDTLGYRTLARQLGKTL